ncbi:hypothetical protein ACQ1Q5_00010 [Ornithobacterium rhinotracheale]
MVITSQLNDEEFHEAETNDYFGKTEFRYNDYEVRTTSMEGYYKIKNKRTGFQYLSSIENLRAKKTLRRNFHLKKYNEDEYDSDGDYNLLYEEHISDEMDKIFHLFENFYPYL